MKALPSWRPSLKDLAELVLIGLTLPLYYLVRGSAHERVGEAVVRASQLIEFEKSLGIFWEVELQSWVLPYTGLVNLLNGFYLYGHLPIIGALAVWLYLWHRPQYLLMRNAFLISGAIGLMIYLTFPVAPPRFLPEWGFVDTVLDQYDTGRPLTPAFFVNEYAAMPSLHFGWNLLLGLGIIWNTKHIWARAFGVIMPASMFLAVVVTGNHFFLDVVAGTVVALGGLGIAYLIEKRGPRLWRLILPDRVFRHLARSD